MEFRWTKNRGVGQVGWCELACALCPLVGKGPFAIAGDRQLDGERAERPGTGVAGRHHCSVNEQRVP